MSLPPTRGGSVPSIRVRTPTVRSTVAKNRRTTEPAVSSKPSLSKTATGHSSENLLSETGQTSLGAPARPSSRTGGARKVSEDRPLTPSRQRPPRAKSPGGGGGGSRDSSPVRKSSSLSRKTLAKLTHDSLTQIVRGEEERRGGRRKGNNRVDSSVCLCVCLSLSLFLCSVCVCVCVCVSLGQLRQVHSITMYSTLRE